MHGKNLTKATLVFIFGICLFFVVAERWIGDNGERWKLTVDSDGRGYYAYLPAIIIFQDLNFDFLLRAEAPVYGKGMADYLYQSSGQRGNRYFVGEAILLAPFFLVAWIISWLAGYSLTGYNQIFFGAVSIAALFYLLAGLLYISRLLRLYKIRENWIHIILILLVFGTNVFHYVVYEPSMSHIYSFTSVSFFLFYLKKYQSEKKSIFIYLSAIALGLITLIRPVNGIIILATPFLCDSYTEFKIFVKELFRNRKTLLYSMFLFSGIVFIQPLILYLTYGDFLYWPYRGESFDFYHPHFFDTLFSYRKGLFIYTPLIFLAILFIIPYFKKSKFASAAFIIFFLILNYVLSSWSSWFYGGSLSLRAFMEFYPLFIIPFAVGLNEIRKRQYLILIAGIFVFVLTVSIIQTYQYEQKIIHFVNMDKDKYWKVFLRTDPKYRLVSYPITNDTTEVKNIILKKSFINDFEGSVDWGAGNNISKQESFSKSHSARLQGPGSYSPAFEMSCRDLNTEKITFAKIQLMTKSKNKFNEGLLINSFENENNKIYLYNSYPLFTGREDHDEWELVKYGIQFPVMEDMDIMKIYIWNDSKNPVYVDDLKIELFSEKR